MMVHSTLPMDAAELVRLSDFVNYLQHAEELPSGPGGGSRLGALTTSLRLDLLRFEQQGRQAPLLEVVAGVVRHSKDVCLHLAHGASVVPLSIFPVAKLVHAPVPVEELLGESIGGLRLLQAEPALLKPPGGQPASLVDRPDRYFPLAAFSCQLAMAGACSSLLAEIRGPAVYRVAPDLNLDALPLDPPCHAAAALLQRGPLSRAGLAALPGMGGERAARLLNALYLQAGLIVSRAHPLAIQEIQLLGTLH